MQRFANGAAFRRFSGISTPQSIHIPSSEDSEIALLIMVVALFIEFAIRSSA